MPTPIRHELNLTQLVKVNGSSQQPQLMRNTSSSSSGLRQGGHNPPRSRLTGSPRQTGGGKGKNQPGSPDNSGSRQSHLVVMAYLGLLVLQHLGIFMSDIILYFIHISMITSTCQRFIKNRGKCSTEGKWLRILWYISL